MKQIIEHIEQLLTKHECVIVPGLGGFVTYKESAKLVGNRFFPPHTVVGFNALLSHSDGLLAEAIMRSKGVDYSTAMKEINEKIALLRQQLNSSSPYMFGKLGTLYLTENNTLAFVPSIADFLPDNLGLEPVVLHALPLEKPKERSITIPIPNYNSTQIWKYAAAIVCLFVLALLSPTPTNYNNNMASLKFYLTPTTLLETVPSPTVEEVITSDSVIVSNVQVVEEVTKPVESMPLRYHIIVASMPTKESAQAYCKENSTSDAPLRVISRNGKHRIALHSYATNTEAFAALDSIRSGSNENRKAWVLKATLHADE